MASGQFYKGKNLRLKFDGKTLFHATSCSLSVTSDTEEIATKDTAGKVVIPGAYGGTLSTEALLADKENGSTTVVDAFDLLQFQLDKTEITWEFSTGVSGDRIISGTTYLTQTDLSAEESGISTGSFSFITTGDIVLAVIV